METRINRNKYVNGSVNLEGHLKKNKRDAYSGLDLFVSVIKNPIQLVIQSL